MLRVTGTTPSGGRGGTTGTPRQGGSARGMGATAGLGSARRMGAPAEMGCTRGVDTALPRATFRVVPSDSVRIGAQG